MRKEIYIILSTLGLVISLTNLEFSLTEYAGYLIVLLTALAVILFHKRTGGEYFRKIVHILCCLSLHMFYISFGFSLSLLFLSTLVLLGSLAVEHIEELSEVIKSTVDKFSRKNERPGYCALNLATGSLLTLLLQYPTGFEYATLSIIISGVGDSIASLVGFYFGKHRLLNKSIEGAFTLFVVVSVMTYTLVGYFSLIVAFIFSIGELCSPIDDNITLPPLLYLLLYFSDLAIR